MSYNPPQGEWAQRMYYALNPGSLQTWIDAGFSYVDALHWAEAGFDLQLALGYSALKLDVVEASHWRVMSCLPVKAKEYLKFGRTTHEIYRRYREVGVGVFKELKSNSVENETSSDILGDQNQNSKEEFSLEEAIDFALAKIEEEEEEKGMEIEAALPVFRQNSRLFENYWRRKIQRYWIPESIQEPSILTKVL